VKIGEGGAERHVTAAEAFLLQLTKRALEGDDAAARASLAVIEQARERQGAGQSRIAEIVLVSVAPRSVTCALEPLRMARKLDSYLARIRLEPWLVPAALARLAQPFGQPMRIVLNATRTPHKVRCPNGGANIRSPSSFSFLICVKMSGDPKYFFPLSILP
jgi:hypothetical protein